MNRRSPLPFARLISCPKLTLYGERGPHERLLRCSFLRRGVAPPDSPDAPPDVSGEFRAPLHFLAKLWASQPRDHALLLLKMQNLKGTTSKKKAAGPSWRGPRGLTAGERAPGQAPRGPT